jgi:hypothetical protein
MADDTEKKNNPPGPGPGPACGQSNGRNCPVEGPTRGHAGATDRSD